MHLSDPYLCRIYAKTLCMLAKEHNFINGSALTLLRANIEPWPGNSEPVWIMPQNKHETFYLVAFYCGIYWLSSYFDRVAFLKLNYFPLCCAVFFIGKGCGAIEWRYEEEASTAEFVDVNITKSPKYTNCTINFLFHFYAGGFESNVLSTWY